MSKSTTLQDATRAVIGSHAVAALPMYDLPQLKLATDAFWCAIAERLKDAGLPAPASLTRTDDYHATWRDPGLLIGQACGYPVVAHLRSAVEINCNPYLWIIGLRKFRA